MLMYISPVILILFSGQRLLTWAQQPPKLTALEAPKDLVAGENFRLSCNVQLGDPPFNIVWYHNDKRLLSHDSDTLLQERSDYSSTLIFKPLSVHHSGTYKCWVNNSAGSDTSGVHLTVNAAPAWVVEPTSQNVSEGSTALIHCNATGSPLPQIVWRKHNGDDVTVISQNGRHQVYSNGTVLFRDLKRSDSGMYTCEVSNGIGANLKKTVLVSVYQTARVQILRQNSSVVTGGSANITCIATGDHPLTVVWMKNEQSIKSSSHLYDRVIVSDSSHEEQIVSSLLMKQVEPSDAGKYTCIARNRYGENEETFRLNVQEPPHRPTAIEVSDIWSRSARVRWESPLDSAVMSYEVQYSSYRNDAGSSETVHGSVTTTLIRDLHPATEYKVTILAINSAGTSEPSSTVRFNTTEEEPSAAPLNVRIERSGATYVLVSWNPPPESDWNGKLLGYYIGYSTVPASDPNPPKTARYSYHTVQVGEDSFTLRGLVKATTYKIIVKAFNAVGNGPHSPPKEVTTLDGEYPPAPLLSVSNLYQGSVQLSWMFSSPVQQHITGYTLHYRQEASAWREVFVASGKQTTYLLSGLDPSKACQVYLVAHSHLGNSEPSDILTVQFAHQNAPRSQSPSQQPSELQEILYIVVPIITVTIMIVILVISVCFYLYIKKTRPPPPPIYADFPRDADFMFAVTGDEAASHHKGTPYSTIRRSTDNEGIYESIVDMRTLSLRRKQANQNSLKKGTIDIVDVCVV
ncbi:cell adhesion molecule Dscam1-like [Ornithodoros turicata]